jgi:hypothetical protein
MLPERPDLLPDDVLQGEFLLWRQVLPDAHVVRARGVHWKGRLLPHASCPPASAVESVRVLPSRHRQHAVRLLQRIRAGLLPGP